MSFFDKLVNTVFTAANAIFHVVKETTRDVVNYISKKIDSLNVDSDQIQEQVNKKEEEYKENIEQFMRLRNKYLKRSRPDYVTKQLKSLSEKILNYRNKSVYNDELIMAKDIKNNHHDFENISIERNNIHILQSQLYVNSANKKCSKCKRSMHLQSTLNAKNVFDFFWACQGFYFSNCKETQQLSRMDLNIFFKKELDISDLNFHEVNQISKDENFAGVISERFNDLISDKENKKDTISMYKCVKHQLKMVPKKKNDISKGLLDTFYLKCPLYDCTYTVKLKSISQLSSVLKKETGNGIL